jgi:hypothetical protein
MNTAYFQAGVSLRSECDASPDWLAGEDVIGNSVGQHAAVGTLRPDETTAVFLRDVDEAGMARLLYESPVLDYRIPAPPTAQFISLQRWEGAVVERVEHEFLARLHDLTASGPEEEATLLMDDVSADDRVLVQPGAVFYLNIGYYISLTGQRIRGTTIRFRRLPSWTADEVLDARARGLDRLQRLVCE